MSKHYSCQSTYQFFTLVGLPTSKQSDQGSHFMSGLFQQVVCTS